jgi:hypothetical protein
MPKIWEHWTIISEEEMPLSLTQQNFVSTWLLIGKFV